MPASSLPLEGRWNGTFEVKEEQREGCAIPTSPTWHCGDADDLFTSHGHLYADQTASVAVKKEPEDVSSTSADANMHSYDCGDVSEFSSQLAGHGDSVISVKEEPEGVPPTSAGESVLPDDGGSMFECRPQLERHKDSAIAVGEEVDQASAALTSEGWDGEDVLGLSVSHHPLNEVQTAAAVVKKVDPGSNPTVGGWSFTRFWEHRRRTPYCANYDIYNGLHFQGWKEPITAIAVKHSSR
uniref:Putative regulation of transcription n=1 Tax=Ixodes ricinus TaxID=34613 RepID=A0A6B0V5B1_IXORI